MIKFVRNESGRTMGQSQSAPIPKAKQVRLFVSTVGSFLDLNVYARSIVNTVLLLHSLRCPHSFYSVPPQPAAFVGAQLLDV